MAKPSRIAEPTGSEPFAGFSPALFDFLEGLSANQTRDWFEAHRGEYEAHLRRPLGAFVEALSLAFAAHEVPLTGDPKRSLFRIHRDVRFSKDKRPYKTNAGATLTRDGDRMSPGLFYVHLGARDGTVERSGFFALGVYGPDPAQTTAIREAIVQAPERWRAVEEALAGEGLQLGTDGSLARMPKGFEAHAEAPFARALKLKSWTVSQPMAPDRIAGPALVDDALAFAQAGLPLLRFCWSALDRARTRAA